MLDSYLCSVDGLSEFVGRNGGAHTLLYSGSEATKSIEAELTFNTQDGKNIYYVELATAIGDKLFLKNETIAAHSG